MTAEVRRKNLGKQFALVHIDSRKIFSWHRPGEPLPKTVEYAGERYILTQVVIDEAKKNQRAVLPKFIPVEVLVDTKVVGPQYSLSPITWVNPKGGIEIQLIDNWKRLREQAKSLALYGGAVTAAALSSWAIVETVKGLL